MSLLGRISSIFLDFATQNIKLSDSPSKTTFYNLTSPVLGYTSRFCVCKQEKNRTYKITIRIDKTTPILTTYTDII